MANGRTILPDLPEATDAQMTDGALATVWTQEQASSSGFVTKKSPLSKVANYVLNKYNSLQLAGVTQTVKSAIDSIMDGFGHLVDYVIGDTPMGTTADTITGAIAEHESDISSLNSNLSVQNISNQITIIEPSYVGEAKLYCFAGHVYYLMVRIRGNIPAGPWITLTRWNNSVGTLDSMPATASFGNGSNIAKNIYALVSPTELSVQLSQTMSSASDYARISAVWFH